MKLNHQVCNRPSASLNRQLFFGVAGSVGAWEVSVSERACLILGEGWTRSGKTLTELARPRLLHSCHMSLGGAVALTTNNHPIISTLAGFPRFVKKLLTHLKNVLRAFLTMHSLTHFVLILSDCQMISEVCDTLVVVVTGAGDMDVPDGMEVDSSSGFMSRTLMVMKGKTSPETRLSNEEIQVLTSPVNTTPENTCFQSV